MQLRSITKNDEKELYNPKRFNQITRRRFVMDRRHRFYIAVGGEPTDVQRIQIGRLIDLEWLCLQSMWKSERGELDGQGYRVMMSAQANIRSMLRELGLARSKPLATGPARSEGLEPPPKPAAEPEPSLHEYIASEQAAELEGKP
jgi:hypothetical protein